MSQPNPQESTPPPRPNPSPPDLKQKMMLQSKPQSMTLEQATAAVADARSRGMKGHVLMSFSLQEEEEEEKEKSFLMSYEDPSKVRPKRPRVKIDAPESASSMTPLTPVSYKDPTRLWLSGFTPPRPPPGMTRDPYDLPQYDPSRMTEDLECASLEPLFDQYKIRCLEHKSHPEYVMIFRRLMDYLYKNAVKLTGYSKIREIQCIIAAHQVWLSLPKDIQKWADDPSPEECFCEKHLMVDLFEDLVKLEPGKWTYRKINALKRRHRADLKSYASMAATEDENEVIPREISVADADIPTIIKVFKIRCKNHAHSVSWGRVTKKILELRLFHNSDEHKKTYPRWVEVVKVAIKNELWSKSCLDMNIMLHYGRKCEICSGKLVDMLIEDMLRVNDYPFVPV